MKIQNYKEIRKGSILASFNLSLPKMSDLTIYGVTLFDSNGKRWVSMPSRAYDDPESGKKKYLAYIKFPDKDLNDRFNKLVLEAVEEHIRTQSPNVKPLDNSDDDLPF
jgi:hypothetical protein